jgi:hypothetical protein
MNLGYLVGTAIFATIFLVAVAAQVYVKRFHPFLYWITSSPPPRLEPRWLTFSTVHSA